MTALDQLLVRAIQPYSDVADKLREISSKILDTAVEVENITHKATISEHDKVAIHAMKNAGLIQANNTLLTLASAIDEMGLLNVKRVRDAFKTSEELSKK